MQVVSDKETPEGIEKPEGFEVGSTPPNWTKSRTFTLKFSIVL